MAEHETTLLLNGDMQPMSLLPVDTINWKEAVSGLFKGIYSVVHEYEDWDIHSPNLTIAVPAVVMLSQYKKPRATPKWNKPNLWLRDDYTCQYCLRVFPANELTRDHVVPYFHGGKTSWENIASACHFCNNRRGHNIKIQPVRKPYKPTYWELVEKRKKYPLYVPHESWAFYLNWPEENIILRKSPL